MSRTAVLMPARIETVVLDGDQGQVMRVLVVPDEPFVDRHDPLPTAEELADLSRLWEQVPAVDTSAASVAAFSPLVARHGGGRAAWLAREFPAGFDPAAVDVRPQGARRVSRFRGLPDRLEVWFEQGDNRWLAKHSAVDTALAHGDPLDPDGGWWRSWKAASDAGLGMEIALEPGTLESLTGIYVVGLTDGADLPGLWRSHADTGRLDVLAAGTATNTVAGAATADLMGSAKEWASTVPAGFSQLSRTLTGEDAAIPTLRSTRARDMSRILLGVLWPALWGWAAKDAAGVPRKVTDELWHWAYVHLAPEGYRPAIRLGDQPYGLLHVTDWRHWVPMSDQSLTDPLVPALVRVRDAMAQSAAARGTVSGANADRLAEILGQSPRSTAFRWRLGLPGEALAWIYNGLGWTPGPFAQFGDRLTEAWQQNAAVACDLFGVDPAAIAVPYPSLGAPHDLQIGLASAQRFPAAGRVPTRALLGRLRQAAFGTGPWEALLDPDRLWEGLQAFVDEVPEVLPHPDSLLVRLVHRSLLVAAAWDTAVAAGVPDIRLVEPDPTNVGTPVVEQALTSTGGAIPDAPAVHRVVDALSDLGVLDRFDADAEPDVDRRLEAAFASVLDTASSRVDPWLTGFAEERWQIFSGPPAAGLYGWVDGPLVGRRGPTEGGLLHAPSDAQARAAAVLRDQTVYDSEGRWGMTIDSWSARVSAQVAEDVRAGEHPAEVLGRLVEEIVADPEQIHALRLLPAFQHRPGESGRRVLDGLAVLAAGADWSAFTADQQTELTALREVVDAYADLLLADATLKAVTGRWAQAQAPLEAAAGLAMPPDLEVLRTPRTGRTAGTTVLSVLPAAATDLTRGASAADPALAGWLDTALSGRVATRWTWRVRRDGQPINVRLAELGLAPADVLLLAPTDLTALVLERSTAESVLTAPTGPDEVRRLAAAVRGLPATAADVDPGGANDPSVLGELRGRFAAAAGAVSALAEQLDQVPDSTTLTAATRWGVVAAPAADLASRCTLAAGRLRERLRRVSETDGVTSSAERIADALSTLVSDSVRVPVLGRHPAAVLATLRPTTRAATTGWLEQVAAVRPALQPMEAVLLAGTQVSLRSNRPRDLWQSRPNRNGDTVRASRLTFALGPAAAFRSAQVHVAVVDRFAEVVPDAIQPTAAAFGFNAPGARPPQAVLLAVTPDAARELDTPTVVEILAETRLLARARMVRPEDLDELAALLPLTVFPAVGRSGVGLLPEREW